jgi:anthranilate synthase/aminodeoxychorismate synthase-like glutamine amidotransferase
MRVLFLENDDSFSWNVVDRLPVSRDAVRLVPGRAVAAAPALLDDADVVVVGPGPTDPERAGLVGVVRTAAARGLPLLGICLGHQALGLAFGARLVRAEPCHGKRSVAWFSEASRFFSRFAGPQVVMRYHSLALADVPAPLRVVAATADGLPMAVEHASLPLAGLQFHPDSFGTPRGTQLLAAFFEALPAARPRAAGAPADAAAAAPAPGGPP